MTPTQADREAAADYLTQCGDGLRAFNVRSGNVEECFGVSPLVQAFTRHRLAAEAAAFEKASGVVKEHQAARLAAKHNALERGQKAEARDHESMAMEAGHILVSIQTFIRKLAGEDGKLWARAETEFNDGRFAPLAAVRDYLKEQG